MARGRPLAGWRFAVAALMALAAGQARAGAWTEPAGQGQMIATLFGWSGQGAPWGGEASVQHESKAEAQTYVEWGLSDELTLVGQLGGGTYRLSAPDADSFTGLDYTTLGARARVWTHDALVFSLQASVLVPGASDAARPAQAGNTGWAADVRALAGYSFDIDGRHAFVDAEAGYRQRTAGLPSEWHGDFTFGVDVAPRLTVLAQTFNTLSLGAGAPGFPAWTQSVLQLSAVYELGPHWSVQAGAFSTVTVRNTNSERGVMAAVWRRF